MRVTFYASIGPLWFTAGGDHFSGPAPLEDAFTHIDRDADAYRAFFGLVVRLRPSS